MDEETFATGLPERILMIELFPEPVSPNKTILNTLSGEGLEIT
jgi:hypothetical protein